MDCVHPSRSRSTYLSSNARGVVPAAITQSIRSCRLTAVQRSYPLLVPVSPRTECSTFLPGNPAYPTQSHRTMTKTNLVQLKKMRSITRSFSHRPMVRPGFILASGIALTTLMTAPNYPRSLHSLGQRIDCPNLPDLVRKYLFEQAYPGVDPDTETLHTQLPRIDVSYANHIKVYHSARAIFCAPSNPSATTGMYHETI